MQTIIRCFAEEYTRYRVTTEKAVSQLNEEELNRRFGEGSNSVAMIIRHVGGNLLSRFTDFLTSDGEKPWRDREQEFAPGPFSKQEVELAWTKGLEVLEATLRGLNDSDLDARVKIRGIELSVGEAITRSLAHFAYHTGQIVLLARMLKGDSWQWISIPPGQSASYNLSPTKEKRPG